MIKMEFIIGTVCVIYFIGALINEINKNKGNAYLAKKYDEEKKK